MPETNPPKFTHVSFVKELNQLEREREREGGRERERGREERDVGRWGWRRGERKTDQKRVKARELKWIFLFPFIEMVLRFEMAPRNGQRSILQYMVPWLSNIELVDECHPPPSGPAHPPPDYPLEEDEDDEGNIGLRGSGWGSLEGTKVVLHNLLYITAKVDI